MLHLMATEYRAIAAVLTVAAVAAPLRAADLWPEGVIYFEMTPAAEAHLDEIHAAMTVWEEVSGVVFVPLNGATSIEDYVVLAESDSNNAAVGRIGGFQPLNIRADSWGWAVPHELGHTLGFRHEHQRPDRDNFISIVWANVRNGMNNGNFTETDGTDWIVDQSNQADPRFTVYDYYSVMHYPECFQSNASTDGDDDDCPDDDDWTLGGATIDFPDDIQHDAGLSSELTALDIVDVRNLYGNRTNAHLSPNGDRDIFDGCADTVDCDLNEGFIDDPYCLDKFACLYNGNRIPSGSVMWLDGDGADPPDTVGTYDRAMTIRVYPGTTIVLGAN